jgi:hypothetical protein
MPGKEKGGSDGKPEGRAWKTTAIPGRMGTKTGRVPVRTGAAPAEGKKRKGRLAEVGVPVRPGRGQEQKKRAAADGLAGEPLAAIGEFLQKFEGQIELFGPLRAGIDQGDARVLVDGQEGHVPAGGHFPEIVFHQGQKGLGIGRSEAAYAPGQAGLHAAQGGPGREPDVVVDELALALEVAPGEKDQARAEKNQGQGRRKQGAALAAEQCYVHVRAVLALVRCFMG